MLAFAWAKRSSGDPRLVEWLRCAAAHLAAPGWSQLLLAFNRQGGYPFDPERLKLIRQPTLILWGDRDDTVPPADAWRFVAAIAGSRLVWLSGCGHVPHLECPQTVAEHLQQFAVR